MLYSGEFGSFEPLKTEAGMLIYIDIHKTHRNSLFSLCRLIIPASDVRKNSSPQSIHSRKTMTSPPVSTWTLIHAIVFHRTSFQDIDRLELFTH